MVDIYIAYVVPSYSKSQEDGYIYGAGVMKASVSQEDLDAIMSDEGVECKPSKVYFVIQTGEENKFNTQIEKVTVYKENVGRNLREAWKVLYKKKSLIFKEIFL